MSRDIFAGLENKRKKSVLSQIKNEKMTVEASETLLESMLNRKVFYYGLKQIIIYYCLCVCCVKKERMKNDIAFENHWRY